MAVNPSKNQQDQLFMKRTYQAIFAICSEQAPHPAPLRYLLPPIEMHAGQLAVVGFCNVNVERLALINESSSVCCHLEDSFLGDLPHRLIELLQVIRNLRYILKETGRVFQCSVTSDCPNGHIIQNLHELLISPD